MILQTSPHTDQLDAALAIAQGEMPVVGKNKQGQRSDYADLEAVITTAKPVLAKHGLALSQWPFANVHEGQLYHGLFCRLSHSSGQWISCSLIFPKESRSGMSEQHALGGNITYFKRYCFAAILGMVAENDDDGQDGKPIQKNYTYSEGKKITENQLKLLNDLINKRSDHVAARTKILELHGINTLAELEASVASEYIGKLKQ